MEVYTQQIKTVIKPMCIVSIVYTLYIHIYKNKAKVNQSMEMAR